MPGVTTAGLVGIVVLVLLVGALLGIGCSAGCSYIARRVSVEWTP
jgi:hypothetical protein